MSLYGGGLVNAIKLTGFQRYPPWIMFGYNPTVQDRSGEISAQGTMNAANSISQGIGTAAQGIGGALSQLNNLRLQANQTDATAKVAHGMGIIDEGTLKTIQDTPWDQKVNLGSNLIQMIGQKTTADRYAAMLGIQQTKANNASAKATGIQPWSGTPVLGSFSSGTSTSDDSQ